MYSSTAEETSLPDKSGLQDFLFTGISLAVLIVLLSGNAAASDNMTEPEYDSNEEVYLVSNLTELNWIRNAPKEDYELTDNINATPTKNWNNGKGWKPIGEQNYEFYGTLNGDGYKISNLTIDRANKELVGFIAITGSDAVIKNLEIKGLSVTGHDYIGGLVGRNNGKISNLDYQATLTLSSYVNYAGGLVGYDRGGSFEDIHASVTINQSDQDSGTGTVGGLIGDLGGSLINSSSKGTINLSKNRVGGLVGELDGLIRNSNSSVNIHADSEVGGLVGRDDYGGIESSYSTGKITGDEEIGGLVGLNDEYARIKNSYSTSKVTGNRSVGGLVGYNDGEIKRSYSTGNVTGDTYDGGLVGWNVGNVKDSFWNTQKSGLSESDGGTGLNTSEMRNFWSFRSSPDIEEENHKVGDPVHVNINKDKIRNISLNEIENSFELVEVNESSYYDDYDDKAILKVNGDNMTITESENITISSVDIGLADVRDHSDNDDYTTNADLNFYLDNFWDLKNVSSFEDVNESYEWNIVDGESYPFLSWEEKDEGNFSVTVDVVDESGSSIENASVQVDYRSKESDQNGEVVFNDLYETEYTAIVDKRGYHENSVNFDLTQDGQTESVTLEEKSSTFNITGLNLSSSQVEKGETVDVNVSVENNGSVQGRRNLELSVDSESIGVKEVDLNAGGTKKLDFSFFKDVEGDYTVKADLYGDEETENVSVGPVKYNLTLYSSDRGSTSPSSDNYTYSEGEIVEVEAFPDTGWKFDSWKGSVSKTSKVITLTMDEHKELTPVFSGDRDISLNVSQVPKTEDGQIKFDFEIIYNEDETVSENVSVDFSGRNITDLRKEITLEANETWSTLENGSSQSFNLIDGDASETASLKIRYGGSTAQENYRIGSVERNFKSGWNYFSLPIVTDQEYSIEEVLSIDKIGTVWTYKNGEWVNYHPDAPSNDLTDFKGGQGYIVKAEQDFTSRPVVNTNISRVDSSSVVGPAGTEINSGWNLIGSYWTEKIAANSTRAFESMPEDQITEVLYSDKNGDLGLKTLGGNDIEPGRAYWVSAKSNASYTKSR
jgi:hypothetical protein